MSSSSSSGSCKATIESDHIRKFFMKPTKQIIINDSIINGVDVFRPMAQAISIRTMEDVEKFNILINHIPRN